MTFNSQSCCHSVLQAFFSAKARSYSSALESCAERQAATLERILHGLVRTETWGEKIRSVVGKDHWLDRIRDAVEISTYEDYADRIDLQRGSGREILCADVVRYEPTSGSTAARKWIPYSRRFLDEINTAAAFWIHDLYQSYPKIKCGRHYWSLSWLPTELRGLTNSDDTELFPWYQRKLLARAMIGDQRISRAPSAEAAWRRTLIALADASDLSFISVWSPTFLLKILDDLKEDWLSLRAQLKRRDRDGIEPHAGNFAAQLWPKLSVVSAWDSWMSAGYAADLKARLGAVEFQGKGLWATEGVVTVPFGGKKILATGSHFFEFRDLDSGQVVLASEVQPSRTYQPILWTSSGLLRYATADRVRMTGFLGNTPCFDFLGRINSVDMVGEKMDGALAEKLLTRFSADGLMCLIGVERPKPHYVAVVMRGRSLSSGAIDTACREFHHFGVARELGQLGPIEILEVSSPFELWRMVGSPFLGQNKPEALIQARSLESGSKQHADADAVGAGSADRVIAENR